MRVLKIFGWVFASLVAFLCTLWATGALYFDFPSRPTRAVAAAAFILAMVAAVVFLRGRIRKVLAVFGGFAVVLCWWFTLKPTNDRPWQPDVAQTAWAAIDGDVVTIHNVRNCDYRTETDFTTHWETRTVRLSQITGMDLAITYWGSPWMAHPIVSFRFADAPPLCFSIETRKAIGQDYSALRGLYRQYMLMYVVADERDSIRVRSNYRHGEDVYLYRTLVSPAHARAYFLDYIASVNALRDQPRWYNAITTNCTTSIRTQRPANERAPWDWRILVNGKGDELLYERHLIATGGLSFAELKRQSWINKRAQAADQAPSFSQLIRADLPQGD